MQSNENWGVYKPFTSTSTDGQQRRGPNMLDKCLFRSAFRTCLLILRDGLINDVFDLQIITSRWIAAIFHSNSPFWLNCRRSRRVPNGHLSSESVNINYLLVDRNSLFQGIEISYVGFRHKKLLSRWWIYLLKEWGRLLEWLGSQGAEDWSNHTMVLIAELQSRTEALA